MGRSAQRLLKRYLRDVAALDVLTQAEEENALAAARQGDDPSRHMVVRSNLALAAVTALRIRPLSLEPLDAIQEGVIVLERLVDDPSIGRVGPALWAAIQQHLDNLPEPDRRLADGGRPAPRLRFRK
jgi:hypothetical protein